MGARVTQRIVVHTLGDGLIDNQWGLLSSDGQNRNQVRDKCLEGKLTSELGGNFDQVFNAYDGFTLGNILGQGWLGVSLPQDNKARLDAYVNLKHGEPLLGRSVTPLKEVKEFITQNSSQTHYVVIGARGYDFRGDLRNLFGYFQSIRQIQAQYLELVRQVRDIGPHVRPVLVLQYRPPVAEKIYTQLDRLTGVISLLYLAAIGSFFRLASQLFAKKIRAAVVPALMTLGLSGLLYVYHRYIPFKATFSFFKGQRPGIAIICDLMQKFYRPILADSQLWHLPILDLANQFNPADSRLYVANAELSIEGGEKVASCLARIIKGTPGTRPHDYTSHSIVYLENHWGYNNPDAVPYTIDYPRKI